MKPKAPLRKSIRLSTVGAAAALAIGCGVAAADEQVSLPIRAGVTETVEYFPAAAPRANAVLFPGGNGILASVRQNFLLRIRPMLVEGGFDVAVADAPSDRRRGMDPAFRASAEHAEDIAAIVAFVKRKADLPVWLVGTSNGSISAANGAVQLGPASVAGAVLTSAVWSGGMSYVPIDRIEVPVLVTHNRGDGCAAAPYAGAEQALARLVRAPAKEFLSFSSDAARSGPCEALAPHGYYGIEGEIAPAVMRWMLAHPG